MHDVTGQDASLASGVQATFQQVGGALGLSVLITIASRHAASLISDGTAASVATTDGYVLAFRVAAALMVVGALLVLGVHGEERVVDAAATEGRGRRRRNTLRLCRRGGLGRGSDRSTLTSRSITETDGTPTARTRHPLVDSVRSALGRPRRDDREAKQCAHARRGRTHRALEHVGLGYKSPLRHGFHQGKRGCSGRVAGVATPLCRSVLYRFSTEFRRTWPRRPDQDASRVVLSVVWEYRSAVMATDEWPRLSCTTLVRTPRRDRDRCAYVWRSPCTDNAGNPVAATARANAFVARPGGIGLPSPSVKTRSRSFQGRRPPVVLRPDAYAVCAAPSPSAPAHDDAAGSPRPRRDGTISRRPPQLDNEFSRE